MTISTNPVGTTRTEPIREPAAGTTSCRVASTIGELAVHHAIRHAVFVREQAVFAHNDHISTLRHTYDAIWNEWMPASGRTVAEAPSLDRHNETFDTRTGNGGVTIWIPVG